MVLIGGDYTFWISRYFVWFQFAAIAWSWVIVIDRLLGVHLSPIHKALLASLVFLLTANNSGILPGNSLDALFLVSVGLALASNPSGSLKIAGYALIGMSALSRHNFLLMLPLSVILLGEH